MLTYPPSEDPNDRVQEELPLLHRTLDAILKCLKRKAFNSPNDFLGIVLYNTQETKSDKHGSDVREHVYCLQPIEQLNGNNIRQLNKIVDGEFSFSITECESSKHSRRKRGSRTSHAQIQTRAVPG